MASSNAVQTVTATVRTLDLVLDPQNARIDAGAGINQAAIREMLLDTEDVADLAHEILLNDGLLLGERIIGVKESAGHGTQYIVLEGNRRTCACQLLIDPSLVPTRYKGHIPACPPDLQKRLQKLDIDVAPSREAAERTITKRHTEPGIKPWSPIAKQRRIARLLDAGKSIEQVMEQFGMSKQVVKSTLRDYQLLESTRKLPNWTKHEKEALGSPTIKPNAFTRFFTLKGAKERIPVTVGDDGKLQTTLDSHTFNEALESLARELLLPDPKTGTTRFNTRATPDQVMKVAFKSPRLKQLMTSTPPPAPSLGTASPQAGSVQLRAKAATFFETLICPIQDDALIAVSKEISTINYKTFPTAATFLLRALIENTLTYAVKKAKLDGQLKRELHTATGGKHVEPGLDFTINFCIANQNTIFAATNAQRVLNQWKQIKEIADLVIHGKWMRANATTLEQAASHVRPFIINVFDGTALK